MSYDTWKLRSDRDECDCPRCSGNESDEDFWGGSEPPYEDEPESVIHVKRNIPSERSVADAFGAVKDFDDEIPF